MVTHSQAAAAPAEGAWRLRLAYESTVGKVIIKAARKTSGETGPAVASIGPQVA
jgi:hypothetical protein